MTQRPLLVVIAGPTAVGKTALCVRLAEALETEVVSADARQFYRELSVGTAKPTPEEMRTVVHHFVGSHSVETYFSVGDYERDCLKLLSERFLQLPVIILTGGSGLFISAITKGLDTMPEADLPLRATLMERLENEGLAPLQTQLQALDPEYFNSMDTFNTQRIIRALEVCISSGKPYSSFRNQQPAQRFFDVLEICVDRPREELYARINTRVDTMLADGLLEEARAMLPFRSHYALKTVGYTEVFDYFDGKLTRQEMTEAIKKNTRNYAKRQLTWFRNQGDFTFFGADDYAEILAFIQ